jgi:hypothetical protein
VVGSLGVDDVCSIRFVCITGFVTLSEAKASHSWPKVQAKLIKCSLENRHSSNAGSSKVYRSKITCTFTVKGQSYGGTSYDFSDTWSGKARAQKQIDEVEAMKTLIVRYKPSDPNINVIYSGVCFVHFIRIILGVGIMVGTYLFSMGVITID